MSDFTDLCESMGLSPGDPEAIDIMMRKFHEEDGEDMTWYYEQQGFEYIDEEDDDNDDE